jgi:hypothetical protein
VYLSAASGIPTDQDVVTAVTGASAALVGFLLVFLGALVAAYQSGLGQLRRDALRRFKLAGWATAIAWLAGPPKEALYDIVLGLFAAELAGLTAVALYTTWRLLLR